MTWNDAPERPNVMPGDSSQQARIEQAIGTLETAVNDNDDIAFLWTGGKEAQVIADLLLYAIGDEHEVSPVPFLTIDTGNHFDEMYEFRKQYIAPTGDNGADTVGPATGVMNSYTYRYDELLDNVIQNPADPRDYHGERSDPECPECGSEMVPVTTEHEFECDNKDCRYGHTVPDEFKGNLYGDWDVAESCGALKIVPLRRIIEDEGYTTLITGRRNEDPLTPGDGDSDGLDIFEEKRSPAPHTRVNPLSEWSEANVYAYIKQQSISLPSLYTDEGYRHTDAKCCVDPEDGVGEYGEGGRDPEKAAAQDRLEEMGYI